MEYLIVAFDTAAFVLAVIGGIIIIYGAVFSCFHFVLESIGKKHIARGLNLDHIRLEFGRNIVLGLEFFIAGDIIETVIVPDYYEIGLLAMLVIIRTVLSFFLNRELEKLTPPERDKLR